MVRCSREMDWRTELCSEFSVQSFVIRTICVICGCISLRRDFNHRLRVLLLILDVRN